LGVPSSPRSPKRYSYKKVRADPEVDNPSELHEEQTIQCLEAGKHTLSEIPIAMILKGAERVVPAGETSGQV
jgi:2-hydroxy-4-carboxymuconate semialdehyde hemiacetal dehydrogenase